MKDFHILWATARPKQAAETYQVWYGNARDKWRLHFRFNTVESAGELDLPRVDAVLTDPDRIGVCNALYKLTQPLEVDNDDVVIVASDDVYPPLNFDTLLDAVLTCKRGMLWVGDGWHTNRDIIAVPICDGQTFKTLNKVIYHPSYHHLWSDNELWQNCKDLSLLVDMRDRLTFEHKHYYAGKRRTDAVDAKIQSWQVSDRENWAKRSKMPVEDRLKV